jgi:uncharacterized protein YndB with AHSA1/START domain
MIDVSHQINAVRRQVGSRTLDVGEARIMTIGRTYPAGIADVWSACTSPERIARWFLPVSGDLRPGGHYQLEGNAGGKIERCEPPTGFAATWEFGGSVSWIEVRLTALAEDSTRLELDHITPAGEHWEQFGPGAVGIGWDLALLGLALHLTGGGLAGPQEKEGWLRSAEGQRFVVLSGEEWRAAHIAAGENEEVARASADRTIAAYTGTPPASS